MTVGAITYYSPSTQYRYFDTTISDAQIQNLMKKYGISQTSDSDQDLNALYQAMYSDAKTSTSSSQTSSVGHNKHSQQIQAADAQNPVNVQWATLMMQVGLYPTGDFDTDYNEFQNKIFAMQTSAVSQQEKASINQLIAEATIVFVSPSTSASEMPSQTPNASHSQSVSGVDILAQLNKMYFLG